MERSPPVYTLLKSVGDSMYLIPFSLGSYMTRFRKQAILALDPDVASKSGENTNPQAAFHRAYDDRPGKAYHQFSCHNIFPNVPTKDAAVSVVP
jgi:hypothetical protein